MEEISARFQYLALPILRVHSASCPPVRLGKDSSITFKLDTVYVDIPVATNFKLSQMFALILRIKCRYRLQVRYTSHIHATKLLHICGQVVAGRLDCGNHNLAIDIQPTTWCNLQLRCNQ